VKISVIIHRTELIALQRLLESASLKFILQDHEDTVTWQLKVIELEEIVRCWVTVQ
jgi:hypothetical protein